MNIDLNNVHRSEVKSAQFLTERMNTAISPMYMSFLYFYHQDNANATMHVAPTRYSPITFRLAEALAGLVDEDCGEIEEVLAHRGQYAEDPGR
jgi:hypothetical protein